MREGYLVENMRKLLELKMKYLNSRKIMLKLMSSHQVFNMDKVKAFLTIISKRHGSRNQINYPMLEKERI
jgi:hypothetical protein